MKSMNKLRQICRLGGLDGNSKYWDGGCSCLNEWWARP